MEVSTYYAPLAFAVLGVVLTLASLASARDSVLRRVSGLTDVLWCGCALLVKSWILYEEIRGELVEGAPWLDLGLIAAFLALLLVLPRRIRLWSCFVTVAVVSGWIWGDLLHIRFFGDVATFATLLAAGNGGPLMDSAMALREPTDWFLGADLIPGLVLAILLTLRKDAAQSPRVFSREVLVGLGLLLPLVLPALLEGRRMTLSPPTSFQTRVFLSANLVRQYGLLGFHLSDALQQMTRLWKSTVLPDEEIEVITEWFVERAPARAATGPLAGFAKGKNLVLIQVESMQSYATGDFDGVRATPEINRLSERALVFNNVTDQSALGRTSDAELLSMVSLLPATDRAAAFTFGGNRFVGLPSILRDHGYSTLSAVPYTPSFWNRHITHPGYGFSDSLFRDDFREGRKIGWGLNDRDFLAQSLDRLEELEPPFFALLITLSLHFPYGDWPEDLKQLPDDHFKDERLRNFLEAMRFLDTAVAEFFVGLEERGLLGETVVVLYGDHDAGMWSKEIREFFNFRARRPNWDLFDQLPLMIWLPGDDAPRGLVETTTGLSDLPVTLLALMGVDPSPYAMMGRNVLGAPNGGVLSRSQGHWIDETYYYQPAPYLCFSLESRRRLELEECTAGVEADTLQRFVSSRVLEYDLQESLHQTLSDRLGLSADSR